MMRFICDGSDGENGLLLPVLSYNMALWHWPDQEIHLMFFCVFFLFFIQLIYTGLHNKVHHLMIMR